MEKIYLFLALFLSSTILHTQPAETFTDYFASSEDFALRQIAKDVEGKADSLLGRCVDSILAGNIVAVIDLSNEVISLSPNNSMAYLFRSVARADLDSMPLAMMDVDRAITLTPELMLAHTTKAGYYLYEDERKKAVATLENAGELMPNRPEPIFLLGAINWERNLPIKARKQWELSVARDSCYVPARVAILVQRLRLGRLGKGIKEIEDLLNCKEVSPDIFHLLALAENHRGKEDAAMAYVNDALDLSPGQPTYLALRSSLFNKRGENEAAVEDLYDRYAALSAPRRRLFGNSSLLTGREQMEAALNYYMVHKSSYEPGLRALLANQLMHLYGSTDFVTQKFNRQALKGEHQNEAAINYYAALGQTGYNGNIDEVLYLTEAALQADPNIPDLYRIRGEIYLERKEFRSAFKDFTSLSEIQPSNRVPIHGMAKVLEATNRIKPAINMYKKVLAIDSTDLPALSRLGTIYLNQQDFATAKEYFDLYLTESKDRATILHNRATCRYMLGDNDGAGTDLRQLSTVYVANSLEVQNLSAVIHTEQDSLQLAMMELNAILFKNKEYLNAYLNRSRIYAKMKDWDNCIEDLNRVIKAAPDEAYAYYERAIAKAALKNGDACNDLQKAISLDYKVSPEILAQICGP